MKAKKLRAIVSVTNDLVTDQRVHKVCSYIEGRGYDVLLVGRLRSNSLSLDRTYQTKRFRLLFNKGPLFYANYTIRLFFYLLGKKADLLLANDLDTLLPNYLVCKLKRNTKLVYDSHEYFTEVPELIDRPFVQGIWEKIEKLTLPNVKYLYTVSPSIANKYEEKYKNKFLVVRNVAPTWNVPLDLKTKAELGIPENKFILIFQGAGINVDRGGEEIVAAMKNLPMCCLLFVGDGDAIIGLKKRVQDYKLTNVLFFKKRPYQELMNFTFHADLGLSLDKGTNLNYAFSLPNKIFDYIQAGTPVLSSVVKEVKALVEKYEIGTTVTEVNEELLTETILEIVGDKEKQKRWKQNCKLAASIENWEKEVEKLDQIYPII